MIKTCTFSNGTTQDSDQTKKFAASDIKIRAKELDYTPRRRFKELLRNYKKMLDASPDDPNLMKLFYTDLMQLLQTVINSSNVNLNTDLGIGSVIPELRKDTQKLSIFLRKFNKIVASKGVIPINLQTEFKEGMLNLVTKIATYVKGIEVLDDNAEEVTETEEVRFTSESSNKYKLFASEESVEYILENYNITGIEDIKDKNILELTGDITFEKLLKSEGKLESYLNGFSSELVPVSIVWEVKDITDTIDAIIKEIVTSLKAKGIIGTLDPNYMYKINILHDDVIQVILYLSKVKSNLGALKGNSGIYEGLDLPTGFVIMNNPTGFELDSSLSDLISKGVVNSELENALLGSNGDKIKEVIILKYGKSKLEEIINKL